jgi:transposase
VLGFTITLGYSRRIWAQAALDQKLGTLLRMHEAAFREWGSVPEEILYDRIKTVWLGSNERGEIVWHPVFLDFARYWGFRPRLCRPYRAQTNGREVRAAKLRVRTARPGPSCLMDFNTELRQWVDGVASLHRLDSRHSPERGITGKPDGGNGDAQPFAPLLLTPASNHLAGDRK